MITLRPIQLSLIMFIFAIWYVTPLLHLIKDEPTFWFFVYQYVKAILSIHDRDRSKVSLVHCPPQIELAFFEMVWFVDFELNCFEVRWACRIGSRWAKSRCWVWMGFVAAWGISIAMMAVSLWWNQEDTYIAKKMTTLLMASNTFPFEMKSVHFTDRIFLKTIKSKKRATSIKM